MSSYSSDEESIVKNEYLRLRNDPNETGSIYQAISDKLHEKGYERSSESIRKKVRRMGLPSLQEPVSTRSAIVIPDLQVPYHDQKALKLVEQYMEDKDWDIYINLGDLLDLPQISHYNDRKPRVVENMRLKEDFDKAEEILRRHRDLVGEDCEMYYLEGNHEERLERYLDKNPEHEGLIEIPNRLPLDELDIQWIKSYSQGEKLTIGEANLVHGRYTNKYHSKKHALKYMSNIFYGHTHDVQSFSMETEGSDHTYIGQSLGCLCDYELQYKQGQPDNWQQAVTTFFFQPNGNFNHYISRIFDYKFVAPSGETYQLD